jgi:hypothetical protein
METARMQTSPDTGVPCSYALLRAVPHPYTGEGVVVGVVLQSRPAQFIGLEAVTDPAELRRLVPDADIELLARYLQSCQAIARGDDDGGEIALLSAPERFHWLTAPRSDVIQPSQTRHERTHDPAERLRELFTTHVEGRPGS